MLFTMQEIQALLEIAVRTPMSFAERLWVQGIAQRLAQFRNPPPKPEPKRTVEEILGEETLPPEEVLARAKQAQGPLAPLKAAADKAAADALAMADALAIAEVLDEADKESVE